MAVPPFPNVKYLTRYATSDGREFENPEQAETHEFYLSLLKAINSARPSSYSPGYDGPMPARPDPDLYTLAAYRQSVAHLFSGIPLPEPEVRTVYKTQVVRKYPHWSVSAVLFLLGAVAGPPLFRFWQSLL